MDNFDQSIETVTDHGTIHKTHGVSDQDISDEPLHHNAYVEIPQSGKQTTLTTNKNMEHRQVNLKK